MNAPTTAPNHSTHSPLQLINEAIGYKNSVTLNNISITIEAGEKVALVGKSGAGKTTLLKRLYRLLPNECAFIHQQGSLVPQLSTFHNIYMGRLDHHSALHNLRNLIHPSPRRVEEIRPIASKLGLDDKLDSRTGQLSGGQQQRVGICRAIYRGGAILMADEPVSSLDVIQQKQIMTLITETDKTVISTLHSIALARQFFTRVIGLRNQTIFFDLPVEKLHDDLLTELYKD